MVNWDEWHRTHPPSRAPSEALVRFIAETFDDPADKSALEIGCGSGANLKFLFDAGFRPWGFDQSDVALGLAFDNLAGRRVALIHATFEEWGRMDRTFDLIVDIEAIYANPIGDIQRMIAEIHSGLREGGWFFGQMMREARDETKPDLGFGHHFTEAELRELFAWADPLTIDRRDWTARNGAAFLGEWLVRARKPL